MCLWDWSRRLADPIQLEIFMNKTRSIYALVAVAAVALAGLGASGAAQARSDVNWSIGVGVPGVVVGVGNGYQGYSGYAPPVYYAPPPPVYYAPPPPVYYYGGGYREDRGFRGYRDDRHRHHRRHGRDRD